eukprot:gene578-3895_t
MATVGTVLTTGFTDQKPGTSGLRKKVKVFEQENYTENFIQSIFSSIPLVEGSPLDGCTLVVGGDGRYFSKPAIQKIIKIAHANKVGKLIVGKDGIFSTPAVSAVIRARSARGGIILSASHNPGGPDNDFGIKYNTSNGGPAPSKVTDTIYEVSKTLKEYHISTIPDVDLTTLQCITVDEHFTVDVIDPVDDYLNLMRQLFDFDQLRQLVSSSSFKMHIDCMHGVSGPYAKRILEGELGALEGSVVNAVPLPDFNGGHPDPNLVYAADLVSAMRTGEFDFGAAFDGDADRNMILGKNGFFVNPSDSLAIITANYKYIKYLNEQGIKGVSRSMPTGSALDHVADKLKFPLYEVPTGWKFFGNLMDADCITLCGEESFGTGSSHIREKDGVWACLCWLSILSHRGESVEEICKHHWQKFGRNFFTRYDYEQVDSVKAEEMMSHLNKLVADTSLIGKTFFDRFTVKVCDNFSYTDVTNNEVTANQGIRFVFEDNSRIVFRLSGTGSSGATIRMYIDSYQGDRSLCDIEAQVALKPLVDLALELSKLEHFTGRKEPTVIT